MSEPRTLDRDAPRDPVTGLPAIETVRGRLGEWLAQAAAKGEPAPVHALLLGLRRFDAVNLAYGASAGDAALAELAARICHFAEHELDGPWLIARGGGGHFLLAAKEPCSRERWQLFAEQLADAVALPIAAAGGALRLSPRLALLRGLAEEDVASMLDRLGHALAAAEKLQGRRMAWADGEAVRPGRTAAQLETDLLGAIDRDEIEILFQPQFALADDRLTGAEALARWRHPTFGRIGAAALFAIAERADHVAPLSRHIARRALAAAAGWPERLRLSLNVTPADLAAASYAEELAAIVAASGFPPDRLTLEVTEQSLLHDIQLTAETLRTLSGKGIRVALDDFGAGFCNFRYLKLLPLDYLKLDRSMVDGIVEDERDLAVLRAIVALAGALGLQVIAEGIESEDQRAKAAEEGCAFYQGFLRAQPMSEADFVALAAG
jgi:EAL domain-containing protein (putative c-di-GMP-specific phosphodiesterase class I)/GGDEF domain-containing protein